MAVLSAFDRVSAVTRWLPRVPHSGVTSARILALFLWAGSMVGGAGAQDAWEGKRLYHDVGRLRGAGISCIECHGGLPGAAFGLGKAAGNPAAIEYALGVVPQMAALRGRLSTTDLADLAAYIARPDVPGPDLRVIVSERMVERLELRVSQRREVRFANVGTGPAHLISAPELAGDLVPWIRLEDNNCHAGSRLEPGQFCRLFIVVSANLRHTLQRMQSARLMVAHDGIGGRLAVALIARP